MTMRSHFGRLDSRCQTFSGALPEARCNASETSCSRLEPGKTTMADCMRLVDKLQGHPAPFDKLRVRNIVRGFFDWKMPDSIYLILSLSKDTRSNCNHHPTNSTR